jgi:hypothetical protein
MRLSTREALAVPRLCRGYSMTMRGGARPTASAPAIFFPYARGDGAEDCRVRVAGVGDGDRMPRIRGLADLEVERHLAQKLGAESSRQ